MRRSIYSVCAAMCFIPTALMSQQTVSAPGESSQADKDGVSIRRVLKSKSPNDFRYAVEQLVGKASKKQLREYKNHSHNSIALHAAWEQVKRSTTINRAQLLELEDDEAEKTIVKMDRIALLQFISFVEGRLQVTPPKWWLAKVRRSKTYWGAPSSLWFPMTDSPVILGRRASPYLKNKGEVHALAELDLTPLAEGRLNVTSGKLSCTIPARFLEAADKDYGPKVGDFGPTTWMDFVGLTAWMNAKRCVFGFHGSLATGFMLHCIDRTSSALLWSTEVRGYFWGGANGGFLHWVEIRRRGETLFLFGIDNSGIVYIEGHSMKDGTNLFHFTTSYQSDD